MRLLNIPFRQKQTQGLDQQIHILYFKVCLVSVCERERDKASYD